MTALVGLFIAAFVAATLIPAQSEALLIALILRGDQAVWLLVIVATTGKVLGSVVNWGLGRSLTRFANRRWFPVPPRRLEQATA